jgi:hypothetical protein
MKRIILSTLVAVKMIGSANAITTLVQDHFIGVSVDVTKWSVINLGGGYITQGGGTLTFNHPNYSDGVYLTSLYDFNTPFEITGSFQGVGNNAIHSFITRASGDHHSVFYNDAFGLNFNFYYGSSLSIYMMTPDSTIVNIPGGDVNITYDPTAWNYFKIADYGNSATVELNGAMIAKIAVDPSFGYGRKIILTDGDNWGYGPSYSSIGAVTVAAVPEPSIHFLFGIGVIGMLIVSRRKKLLKTSE